MTWVRIDLTNLDLSENMKNSFRVATQSAIQTSLALIKDKWQMEAQNRLRGTLPLYLMGLDMDSIMYPYQGDPFSGAVSLRGKLPNMIEQGSPPFDMKKGFAKSPKRKSREGGGWYLTIPIRHGTPGTFMWGKPMSKDIHAEAKKLGNRQSLNVKGGTQTSWAGYQHKSNIYDGLTRTIQQGKHSQYVTFRRVSDKSDPNSWMHPGFEAVSIAQDIESYARSVFRKSLEANLKEIM